MTCSFGINVHWYTDDTQLDVPVKADDDAQIRNLEVCLSAVKNWMLRNFLLLNSDKTDVLVISPAWHRHQFDQVTAILNVCDFSKFNSQ